MAKRSIARRSSTLFRCSMSIDETFDVGLDTRTPVDFTYHVPFAFTGTIDKLNYKLGPSQLSAEDRRKAAAMMAAAND